MKISIEKNLIYKSLSHVQSIVEKKNTVYASLSLFLLIDKKLIEDKNIIFSLHIL